MNALTNRIVVSAMGIMLFALPSAAFACGACYGAVDSPQTNGMNFAILSMLGVTGGVLAAMTSFFLHLRKRARAFVERESSPESMTKNGELR